MRGPVLIVILLLIASGQAAAGAQPALYFLRDGELGPIGTGIMNETAPDGLDPSTRLVIIGTPELPSATFQIPAGEHASQLYGPVFVGLWTGPSVVLDGNITVTLYDVAPDDTLTPLLSASTDLDLNTTNTPDPMSFVPPDPTDPEAAAAYLAAKALLTLLQPPKLMLLGALQGHEVAPDHTLALGFYLEAGSDNALPVPLGVAATIQYDAALMPTFAFIPWFEPIPSGQNLPSPTPRPTAQPTPTATPTPTPEPQPEGSSEKKDSPGFSLFAGMAFLAAAVALRRRH